MQTHEVLAGVLQDAMCRMVGHMANGRYTQAGSIARQILRVDPANQTAKCELAFSLDAQGHAGEAESLLLELAESHKTQARVWIMLGWFYAKHHRSENAVAALQRASVLDPQQKEFALAMLPVVVKGCDSDPEGTDAALWHRCGSQLADCGRSAESIRCFENAIEQQPDFAESHYRMAVERLRVGQYEQGFADYEWRWEHFKSVGPYFRTLNLPTWKGEPIEGRRLVLFCERGISEWIQFARFISHVKHLLGPTIAVYCPRELAPLLAGVEGVDHVIRHGDEVGAAGDCQFSVMSLPYILGVTQEVSAGKYLTPTAKGCPSKGVTNNLKVGLAWGGNPMSPNDQMRSIRLRQLDPLDTVLGTAFFGLQKDTRARVWKDQLVDLAEGASIHVNRMDHLWSNFDVAAADINDMDVVISVDTAVAHIAAAMGKETWVLLPHVADWTWGVGNKTVWYPSVTLYRQQTPGDWSEVVERVTRDLRGKVAA